MSPQKKKLLLYFLSTAFLVAVGLAFAFADEDRALRRLGTFPGGVLFAACSVSAVTDMRSRKILNVVTYPSFLILLLALLISPALPPELAAKLGYEDPFLTELGRAISGFLLCFALLFVLFAGFQGGAGDAKLAASIGLALGMGDGIVSIGAAFVFAFAYSLLLMFWFAVADRFARGKTKEEPEASTKETPAPDAAPNSAVAKALLAPLGFLLSLFMGFWSSSKKVKIPMGLSFWAGTTCVASGVLTDFLIGLTSGSV